jgi:hypothetical protein
MDNIASASLIAFYLGEFPDSEGRMLEQIWAWDYMRLEYVHNYIQWLFPLKQRSHFNPRAPVLDDEVIAAFRENKQLKAHLLKSFKVMLKFYGLQCNEGANAGIEVAKSDEYQQRKPVWLNPHNHNYLRITRILTSLRLLGLEPYAQAFFKCLDQIYAEEKRNIGAETYAYWKSAVG